MSNYRRGRPKNARSGCLLCKSHKMNGMGEMKRTVQERRQQTLEEAIEEYYEDIRDAMGYSDYPDWDTWDWYDDEVLEKYEVAPGKFSFGD